eukprot:COSAG01_NODE_1061_length_11887_cov_151.517557_1_plen_343_part_00
MMRAAGHHDGVAAATAARLGHLQSCISAALHNRCRCHTPTNMADASQPTAGSSSSSSSSSSAEQQQQRRQPHSWEVSLHYQRPAPPGKCTGRYINQPDRGDVVDETQPRRVTVHNARALPAAPTLATKGFTCVASPTVVQDFEDEEDIRGTYYDETAELVRRASGASRVVVFDHTMRETGQTSLNARPDGGGKAAPVPRVHCDYTEDGAPRRLRQLCEQGVVDELSSSSSAAAARGGCRFMFINAWRSVSRWPVQRQPLALVDARSVPAADRFLYELRFPDRTGENYSLRYRGSHMWWVGSRLGYLCCRAPRGRVIRQSTGGFDSGAGCCWVDHRVGTPSRA